MLTAEQSILALIRTIIIGNEDIEYLGSKWNRQWRMLISEQSVLAELKKCWLM